jgi:16S rRNA U1498 N3-methylase RsmE
MYFYLPTQNYPQFQSFLLSQISVQKEILEDNLKGFSKNGLGDGLENTLEGQKKPENRYDFAPLEYNLKLSLEDSAHIMSMRKKAGDTFKLCNQNGLLVLAELLNIDKKQKNCTILIKGLQIFEKRKELTPKEKELESISQDEQSEQETTPKQSKNSKKVLFQAVLDKDYLEKFFESIAFGSFDTVYLFTSDFSPNPAWVSSMFEKGFESKNGFEISSDIAVSDIVGFDIVGFDIFAENSPKTAFLERLKKILIRSTEQCERVFRTQIIFLEKKSALRLIEQIKPTVADTLVYYKSDSEDKKDKKNSENDLKMSILIGPEGGFSDSERSFFASKNLKISSLGELVYPGWACHLFF